MKPVWLDHYPNGIPAEADVRAYASLTELLAQSCRRFAELPAFGNMGASITFAELDHHSRDFSAYLQGALGLRKGDRVAIMLPNLLQYPVAMLGVLRAGMVVVNVNPQYTAPELAHPLRDSGASAIVVLENFAHTLQEVLEKHPTLRPSVITTEVGDMFPMVKELLVNVAV
jgi:long-chain acyl-CoA synthetase